MNQNLSAADDSTAVQEREEAERISRALERDYRRYPHLFLEGELV
ncbi:MAG: hypothetical protein E7L17_10060 [Clostridium sp.]|nr:hypothetical protein [Clostridium sp.]MDU7338443.1 hypothetical protein [Clostridium sp.]